MWKLLHVWRQSFFFLFTLIAFDSLSEKSEFYIRRLGRRNLCGCYTYTCVHITGSMNHFEFVVFIVYLFVLLLLRCCVVYVYRKKSVNENCTRLSTATTYDDKIAMWSVQFWINIYFQKHQISIEVNKRHKANVMSILRQNRKIEMNLGKWMGCDWRIKMQYRYVVNIVFRQYFYVNLSEYNVCARFNAYRKIIINKLAPNRHRRTVDPMENTRRKTDKQKEDPKERTKKQKTKSK